jgi:hypothetical protein
VDQRASWPLGFAPDGRAVVYTAREKGIDQWWLQRLDGCPYRQLTHFPSDSII